MHRTARRAALFLLLPAMALAQDAKDPASNPRGRLLLDALPPRADLVVHTPDLHAFLATAEGAGLGGAAVWRAAFDDQLRAWGAASGQTDRLVKGAGAFLDAAIGEAVVASFEVPSMDLKGKARATVLAFRTDRKLPDLKAAFEDVYAGGLRVKWEGAPHDEEVGGRRVIATASASSGLWIALQNGFVAAADHPLALGLLFGGLERQAKAPPQQLGLERLTVRYGRGDAQWTGWVWGDRESVSWRTATPSPLFAWTGEPPVVAVGADDGARQLLPQFFAPLDASKAGVGEAIAADGAHVAVPASADAAAEKAPGFAGRLAWLRAFAAGKLELPVPDIAPALLAAPLASAEKASEKLPPLVAWKATDTAGELRGPVWHGPATFLALRTLHDIAYRVAPGSAEATSASRSAAPAREPVPLPDPVPPK